MELLIKENKNDTHGKVVNMNPLFAKIMIGLGKAEKKPKGAKLKDLFWCELVKIHYSKSRLKKGEQPRKVYNTHIEDYKIMQKEDGCGEAIYSSPLDLKIKDLYEKVDKNLKGYKGHLFYIATEKPLKKVLKQNALWTKGWDDETFLTAEQIKLLEKILHNLYFKKLTLDKEIIV